MKTEKSPRECLPKYYAAQYAMAFIEIHTYSRSVTIYVLISPVCFRCIARYLLVNCNSRKCPACEKQLPNKLECIMAPDATLRNVIEAAFPEFKQEDEEFSKEFYSRYNKLLPELEKNPYVEVSDSKKILQVPDTIIRLRGVNEPGFESIWVI